MKKIRLSLTQQVLILVAIPICFQLAFVVVLSILQHEAEEETKRALKAHEIADRINLVTRDIYAIWDLIDKAPNEMLTPTKFYASSFQPILARLKAQYKELAFLAGDNKDLQAAVERSTNSVAEAEDIINQALMDLKQRRIDQIMQHYEEKRERLRNLFRGLITNEFVLIAEHEREISESSNRREMQLRQTILDWVLGFCFLNVCISVWLAIYLVKTITARLAVLSDNVRRYSVHAPLHSVMLDNDEIAGLDRSFHQLTRDLDEAARAQKEMVNMITHDLRSPLTAIRGTLEVFQEGRASTEAERGKKLLALADRNTRTMMGLIDDLLDIEKIKSGMMTLEKADVCLAETFESVKSSVDAWIEDQGLKMTVQDTALFVKADEQKLERVLFNLVANGIKFSPSGGVISIAARETADGLVEVTVSDQGKGIPKDKMGTIFDRFQQAHTTQVKGGSGLGLAICKSIVELHGGQIWVTSEEGKGSTFHFTLPKA